MADSDGAEFAREWWVMRLLILGGDGMLGHQLLISLSGNHQAIVTLRQDAVRYRDIDLFSSANAIFGVEATDIWRLREVIRSMQPDVVINGIGVVKQDERSEDVIRSVEINALLPHQLAKICEAAGSRLVHISTDCVFSGQRGNYREDDVADATDIYGRTKLLGEVASPGCITLRTSMIGLELKRRKSLIEWFLAQRGTIRGYTRAIYSGLTTMELARVIQRLLEAFPELEGLYHVASEPISKYQLLQMLAGALGRTDVAIEPYGGFVCDRSLCGEKFEHAIGYRAPSWQEMVAELAQQISIRYAA
jgi:dTDP-4-dehydrorhamnose reductase